MLRLEGYHHQCFGVWRRVLRSILVTAAGGVFGLWFVIAFFEQPATELVVAVALLGAVVGAALGQATRFS
jgi:hypothetical protein